MCLYVYVFALKLYLEPSGVWGSLGNWLKTLRSGLCPKLIDTDCLEVELGAILMHSRHWEPHSSMKGGHGDLLSRSLPGEAKLRRKPSDWVLCPYLSHSPSECSCRHARWPNNKQHIARTAQVQCKSLISFANIYEIPTGYMEHTHCMDTIARSIAGLKGHQGLMRWEVLYWGLCRSWGQFSRGSRSLLGRVLRQANLAHRLESSSDYNIILSVQGVCNPTGGRCNEKWAKT